MIIAYHIFYHCINVQLTDTNLIAELENGWYCHPWFSKELCILAVVSPMGQTGNAIFIIVSGYFMAHKESVDLTKISKKLLLQLGFAAMMIGFVSIFAYHSVTEFSVKLVQFSAFNGLFWYIGYYFVVMVIAKIFLNRYLMGLTQKNYVMFLMTLFAIIQFSWSAGVLANLGNGLEILCAGIFFYSLGGYVKKYDPFSSIRLWALIGIIIAANFIVLGNFYISTANRILAFNPDDKNMFIQSVPIYGNHHIVPVVLGVAIFELFRRIKVPNNRVINFMGAATFMVYLLHDNEFFYYVWRAQDWITILHNDVIQFLITYVVWVLKTFMVGVLGYCLFEIVGKLLNVCKPLVLKKSACTSKEES